MKPITPKQHGIIDYGFAAGLLLLPRLLGANAKAVKLYDALACNVIAINGSTDHRVGFAPLISVKAHQKIDYANLALLYGLFASKTVNRDNKALGFHSALTGLATLHVLLTDYDAKSFREISK
ncbi:hypothetical protein [uncultured Flavobacterium sp.]|uniref:hypothetical protein n=1 Tax=uncultured Flavobacterium sp. TaxID=165435 RepID=UPI0025DA35A6|nr:hypothetical protein [uncultured Flavobacterium sp.]